MGTTLTAVRDSRHRQDAAMAALAQANRVRLRRASLMRWMHGRSACESHERAAELISSPTPALSSMLVLGLLQRVRQVGPVQAERCSNSQTSRRRRTIGA